MTIFALRNEGGYEEYAYDITSYMKKIFIGVKKAYLCFYADNIKQARYIAKEYWDEKDIKNKNFEADSDTIILELENGNIIKLWNSEWGGVSVIKEGIIRTDGDYAKLADRKQ